MKTPEMLSIYVKIDASKIDWVECGQLLGISSDKIDQMLSRIESSLQQQIREHGAPLKVNGGVEFPMHDMPDIMVRLSGWVEDKYTNLELYSTNKEM